MLIPYVNSRKYAAIRGSSDAFLERSYVPVSLLHLLAPVVSGALGDFIFYAAQRWPFVLPVSATVSIRRETGRDCRLFGVIIFMGVDLTSLNGHY